ncbi:hypothetical protein NE237_006810 [Protea cynaroides]|uniref:Uncharacterized protein n=1 Tax=Protea cynaroides TaxID=273540 RepID=A0A9Q0KNT0_9MAGN|nr:hypothetical protein NE237_006810 [Protea cynaroides]
MGSPIKSHPMQQETPRSEALTPLTCQWVGNIGLCSSTTCLPKVKLLHKRESPYSSLSQGLGKLTSLEILDIQTCSKIKSILEGELQYLTALQELTIMRCPTLRKCCQKEIGKDWSKISYIPKIFIDVQKIK